MKKTLNRFTIVFLNVICFGGFVYYFNNLFNQIDDLQTNLQIKLRNEVFYPHLVFCVRKQNLENIYDNSPIKQVNNEFELNFIYKNQTEKMFWNQFYQRKGFLCLVYQQKERPGSGLFLVKTNSNIFGFVIWYQEAIEEVFLYEVRTVFKNFQFYFNFELFLIKIKTKHSWRTCQPSKGPFDSEFRKKIQFANLTFSQISKDLYVGDFNYDFKDLYKHTCSLQQILKSQTSKNKDQSKKEFTFRLQNLILIFETQLVLNTIDFIWLSTQLLSMFFELTILGSLNRL